MATWFRTPAVPSGLGYARKPMIAPAPSGRLDVDVRHLERRHVVRVHHLAGLDVARGVPDALAVLDDGRPRPDAQDGDLVAVGHDLAGGDLDPVRRRRDLARRDLAGGHGDVVPGA